jgi:hypothetical protein
VGDVDAELGDVFDSRGGRLTDMAVAHLDVVDEQDVELPAQRLEPRSHSTLAALMPRVHLGPEVAVVGMNATLVRAP